MNKNPTIEEMVAEKMRLSGYDGLYNTDILCQCRLDEIFIHCENPMSVCQAGFCKPVVSKNHLGGICRDDDFVVTAEDEI